MDLALAEVRQVSLVNTHGATTDWLEEVSIVVEDTEGGPRVHGLGGGLEFGELGILIETHKGEVIFGDIVPEDIGDNTTEGGAVPEGLNAVVSAVLSPDAGCKPVKQAGVCVGVDTKSI